MTAERVTRCEHPGSVHEEILGCMWGETADEWRGTCPCYGNGTECGPAAPETETNEQAERYELDRGDA